MSHNATTATGCPVHEVLAHDPVPFFSNGNLNFKAHDVGWLVCIFLTIIASTTSCWLIKKHLSFYYHPTEQRHMVRLLLMPVIYAVCSTLSYMFYRQALYFQLVRDCYEALVIAAFFFLLLSFLSNPPPTSDNPVPQPFATKAERDAQLRDTVKDLHLRKWMWPMGWLKWRPARGGPAEGEYVLVRPLSTLASVIGEGTGYYCLASWSPKFVHIWSSAAISISVTVAMYCVLQLYMPLREPLKPHKPVLKFLCVKSVVFFTFWQETSLSFLVTVGVIKDREYWTAEEIVIGLSAMLSCVEMVIFAFLHVKAFSYLPYRALASPVHLTADGAPLLPSLSPEHADFDPEKAHSFASWSAWHDRVAAKEAALSRLAKPKLPAEFDASSGAVPRKADGLPLLQQTRKWPALLAALDLRDLFGEIGEETRFVLRGGRVDETALLEARRGDDLERALGARRPPVAEVNRGSGYDDEEETELECDLRRLREGYVLTGRGAKVGQDSSLVRPRRTHLPSSAPSRALMGGYDRRRDELVLAPPAAAGGWWDSLNKYGSRGRRPPAAECRTFEQVPRPDYAAVPAMDVPAVIGTEWRIPVPPPHRLGTPHSASRPRTTLDAPCAATFGAGIAVRKEVSSASSAAASHDSYTHLPRTTLRPASYVPPHKASPVPSPPPFSHFRRQSQPSAGSHSPLVVDDRFTACGPPSFARRSSPAHAHSRSVPIASFPPTAPVSLVELAPPPAVLLMASPESRRSQGLPPGAMPPPPQ